MAATDALRVLSGDDIQQDEDEFEAAAAAS